MTLFQLFTDAYFTTNCIEAARRHNGKTFVYYYDHRNRRTFNELFGTLDHEDLSSEIYIIKLHYIH